MCKVFSVNGSDLEGSIAISANFKAKHKNENTEIEFRVKDSGIGIAAENIDKVFEEFSQSDNSTTRKFGGTGLGLTICKKLVKMFGGSIQVTSEIDHGTEFVFNIFCQADVNAQAISKTDTKFSSIPKLSQVSVLVVEDNAINIAVAKGFLKKLGVSPDIAKNGKECLDLFKNTNYDVILMDCHMPIMDGFEASEIINRKFAGKKWKPKIVAVTASVMKTDIERCFAAGMDDFIPKPLSLEALQQILQSVNKNAA